MRSQKISKKSCRASLQQLVPWSGRIILTFVDIQHEAIEVDSLFMGVFHTGVKHIHEHGLPCA